MCNFYLLEFKFNGIFFDLIMTYFLAIKSFRNKKVYGLNLTYIFVISGRTTGKSFFQGVSWGHPSDDNYTLRTLDCFVFTFGLDKTHYIYFCFSRHCIQSQKSILIFPYILKPSIFRNVSVHYFVFAAQNSNTIHNICTIYIQLL